MVGFVLVTNWSTWTGNDSGVWRSTRPCRPWSWRRRSSTSSSPETSKPSLTSTQKQRVLISNRRKKKVLISNIQCNNKVAATSDPATTTTTTTTVQRHPFSIIRAAITNGSDLIRQRMIRPDTTDHFSASSESERSIAGSRKSCTTSARRPRFVITGCGLRTRNRSSAGRTSAARPRVRVSPWRSTGRTSKRGQTSARWLRRCTTRAEVFRRFTKQGCVEVTFMGWALTSPGSGSKALGQI